MGLKLLVEQSLDCKETEIKITCISMRAQFSGRLEATLKNNEKVIISKHYIKSFRDKFEQ